MTALLHSTPGGSKPNAACPFQVFCFLGVFFVFCFLFFVFFCLFAFSRAAPARHTEIPRLGIESEL